MMKKTILLAAMALAVLNASAQDNPYIVKTKNVKKTDIKSTATSDGFDSKSTEPKDFLGKNFRYYSLCDWQDGMRFMVMPEKYDLLVNTFHDAVSKNEVSSARLRYSIMVYKGHEDMPNGRVHVNFYCETDGKRYYYELPNGMFDDYCMGKLGVPTLAYLGDVDKAKELLLDKSLITRTEYFRIDTEYDGEGYQEVKYPKNKLVTVKAVGVGTRSFPVKIIVEDENGEQFFQNVAMSKTNSGLRDDEFDLDNAKYLFAGSFEFTGGEMAVSADIGSYLNKVVYTKYQSMMSSKGSGKARDVVVPRFTGFIIDAIVGDKNNPGFYALTLRESESRRIYYKDVTFRDDVPNATKEDFFGYLFGMGEGMSRNTTLETRTAIREGRVIPGMTMEEVEMAVGVSSSQITTSDGVTEWMYPRSNSVLVVQFDKEGIVTKAGARRATSTSSNSARRMAEKNAKGHRISGNGTPVQ